MSHKMGGKFEFLLKLEFEFEFVEPNLESKFH